jgi:hypothetical protein
VQRARQRQRLSLLLVQQRLEGLARQALHRHKQMTFAFKFGGPDLAHGGQIRVRYSDGPLHIGNYACGQAFVPGEIRGVDLQRDLVTAAAVLRGIQHSLRSAFEDVTDAIATEGLARQFEPH